MGKEAAVEELKRCSGTQLDKEVVEAFIQAYQKGEI
jgi:HD-GYP domain-containing protein (c-di-GMP phosphodiesterase class II)